MQVTVILAFAIVALLQAAGEIFSAKTKGKVPSIFVSCILFLIGFWTVIPTQVTTPAGAVVSLTEMAGISGSLFSLLLALLVTNMGTLMSIHELFAQWKTIVIGVAAVIAGVAMVYILGILLFEVGYGVVVAPSLVGGLAAVNLMMQASNAVGRSELATIAILIFSLQGIVGYPLMNFFLRKQAKAILEDYKAGKVILKDVSAAANATPPPWKIFPDSPAKYQTPIILLGKLALVTFLAETVSKLTGGAVNTLVVCLLLGIAASELGFLEKKLLTKADTMGLLMVLLMGFVFGGLATATPEILMSVFAPLVTLFFLGTAALVAVGIIIGKIFKESWAMSGAIVLNCLCGFPPNFVLTNETSKSMSTNQQEYEVLMQEMLPKVLVGGFATVTVTSVIIADVFTRFL